MEGVKDNLCNFTIFSELIKSIVIGNKFCSPEILKRFYNEFKNTEGLMDFKKMVTEIRDKKESNDFFCFQEKYFGLLDERLIKSKVDFANFLEENENLIKTEQKIIKERRKVHDSTEYDNKNVVKQNDVNDKNIGNSQPSKEFILHLLGKRNQNAEKYNDFMKSFKPESIGANGKKFSYL